MQPVRIAIDINPRDIPALVCSESSQEARTQSDYKCAISEALAEALGVKEYLFHPERINELRRLLWEKDQNSRF